MYDQPNSMTQPDDLTGLRRALAERERQLDAVRHIAASLCSATKLDDLLRRALGTRIVKNVIDAHGGLIELESAPGAGTAIRCRIPASRS